MCMKKNNKVQQYLNNSGSLACLTRGISDIIMVKSEKRHDQAQTYITIQHKRCHFLTKSGTDRSHTELTTLEEMICSGFHCHGSAEQVNT